MVLSVRIIPARAGFTMCSSVKWFWVEDHPRSRGVYLVSNKERAELEGSSPLARGLLVQGKERTREPGIIPARAGFTYCTYGPRS